MKNKLLSQQIDKQIDEFIHQNQQDIFKDIAKLVAIPSVEEPEDGPGKPFGAGPRKALDQALSIARGMGLATNDGDGYVGWAEIKGQREEYLATITHLDVVPAGDGWVQDPFEMTEREGWILGRGVQDDKGPSVLCLYAAKFLAQLDQPLPYSLRILLGCNEESGMGDVPYYLERNAQPLFCFSPDTAFPVCNGEKGILSGNFSSPVVQGKIVEFTAGTASNVIPEKASCLVKADWQQLPSAPRIMVQNGGEGLAQISAEGIAGHAASPEGTINAIGLVVNYLVEHRLYSEQEKEFLLLLQKLHQHPDGSGLSIAWQDPVFEPLTCVGGMVEIRQGRLVQNINIRYPQSASGSQLTQALEQVAAQHGASFTLLGDVPALYIPVGSKPIDVLMQAYNEVSNKQAKPFTTGGGTYARQFERAVSFGPDDQDKPAPDFVGSIHGPQEGANKDVLLRALKIYILSLLRLMQLSLEDFAL